MTQQRRQPDFDTYTFRLPVWSESASDRVDRLVLTLAVLVTLLAVPVAGGVGVAVYDSNYEMYAKQALSRHVVAATVTEDAASPDLRRDSVRVRVEWDRGATRHTDTVRASPTVEAGDVIEIWVDDNGSMVSAPTSPTTAALDAAAVAVITWVTVAAVAGFAVSGVRVLNARMRNDARQRAIDTLLERG